MARATDVLRGLSAAQIREKARADARDVLTEWWTQDVFPVDPVTVARSLGMSVFAARLGDDVFGVLVGSMGGADVYLDADQPAARFRFSCAHEIGHYVVRTDAVARGEAFVDRRSDAGDRTAHEVYANEFAGSLLVPEAALRAAVADGANDFDLIRRFGVPLGAVRGRRYAEKSRRVTTPGRRWRGRRRPFPAPRA